VRLRIEAAPRRSTFESKRGESNRSEKARSSAKNGAHHVPRGTAAREVPADFPWVILPSSAAIMPPPPGLGSLWHTSIGSTEVPALSTARSRVSRTGDAERASTARGPAAPAATSPRTCLRRRGSRGCTRLAMARARGNWCLCRQRDAAFILAGTRRVGRRRAPRAG
jgi:hypothetical protein